MIGSMQQLADKKNIVRFCSGGSQAVYKIFRAGYYTSFLYIRGGIIRNEVIAKHVKSRNTVGGKLNFPRVCFADNSVSVRRILTKLGVFFPRGFPPLFLDVLEGKNVQEITRERRNQTRIWRSGEYFYYPYRISLTFVVLLSADVHCRT